MIFVTVDIHDYFYSYICCPYVLCFGYSYTTMNRVSLLTKGVWFSEDVCEGVPNTNTHVLQLPAPDIPDWTFGLKTLLRYSSSPFWGRGSPGLECENQGWYTGPSWDSGKSHKSLRSPATVCSQLESPPEGIFGHLEKPLNFLLQLRDPETALNDTEGQRVNGGHEIPDISLRCPQGHNSPERLQGEHFSLFRNVYFSSKARRPPLVKMAAQNQLPRSSWADENFLGRLWWPGNVGTDLEAVEEVTGSLKQPRNFLSTPGNLGILRNLLQLGYSWWFFL